jgi:hypothetical protein
MSTVAIGFFVPDQVFLTFGSLRLIVDFSEAEVRRVIVLEPAIRKHLLAIMLRQSGKPITWANLRLLMEERGVDVRAISVRNRKNVAGAA